MRAVYELSADVSRLAVPPRGEPYIGRDLWRHTCFELFLTAGLPGYFEFNFSPSRAWAVYGFDRYRDGGQLMDERHAPRIDVRAGADSLRLEAWLAREALPAPLAEGPLLAGASAVLEDADGRLSYWALLHPRAVPDFHDAGAFVLRLDSPRR